MISMLGAIITSIFQLTNTLLPFTKAGTPLLQDIAHTALICALLYFAPKYVEQRQQRQQSASEEAYLNNDNKKNSETHVNDGLAEDHSNYLAGNQESVATPGYDAFPREEIDADSDLDNSDDETDVEARPDVPEQQFAGAEDQPRNEIQEQQTALLNTRVVSTKKARSLARRSQRRAYNEFLRSQGDAARAEAAAEAARHEASAALERARRSAADAAAESRLTEERQTRKELTLAKAAKEESRTQMVVTIVKKRLLNVGLVDIEKDILEFVDELNVEKVEKIVRAAGIERIRLEDGQMVSTVILKSKFIVNLDEELIKGLYNIAATTTEQDLGKVTWAQLGGILESLLLKRVKDKTVSSTSKGVESSSILQSLRLAIRT